MKKIRVLLCWLAVVVSVHAQELRTYDYNTNTWFKYLAELKLHNHWGVNLETQIRRSGGLDNWQQYLLRGGINYYLNDQVTFTAGYAFFQNYPYGNYPIAYRTPEDRLFQQVQLKQKINRLSVTHRYMLEERWQGIMKSETDREGWSYQNRFRYKITLKYPIGKSFFATAFDEIFISFGDKVKYNLLSQNRSGVTLGYTINQTHNVQLGYMNQWKVHSDGKEVESNATIWLIFTSRFDLTKKHLQPPAENVK